MTSTAARQARQQLEQLNAFEEAPELRDSLRAFTVGCWPVLEPATRFKPNWHIDAIVEHLEACTAGDIRRLIINVPPRHMKSLNVSVVWPVWTWTRKPHTRFLTASYGDSLATRDALKSRRLIQSRWYQMRFRDDFQLAGDQNQKTRYENDRGGYRIATSVGGSGTGEGGDVIIIDDPHKADEAESATERQAVLDWHDGTISTRFNDPELGVEVVVMQRLHEQDLAGHLLSFGGWTHLCLPAEYEPAHPFVWPDDPRGEPGDLLWPEHFGPDALADLKVVLGSYRAAGQLQQRPAPAEGGIFKTADWRYFDPANLDRWNIDPPPARIVTFWDTALKDKATSDFTVGATWAAAGANRYLLRVTRGRMSLTDTKLAVRAQAAWVEETFPNVPHSILVENAANGPDVIAQLRNVVPGLLPSTPQGDKVMRAHAVSGQLEAHQLFVPGAALPDGSGPDPARTPSWVQEWITEHSSFPNTANDDQVDTTTGALLRIRSSAVTVVPEPAARSNSAGLRDKTF